MSEATPSTPVWSVSTPTTVAATSPWQTPHPTDIARETRESSVGFIIGIVVGVLAVTVVVAALVYFVFKRRQRSSRPETGEKSTPPVFIVSDSVVSYDCIDERHTRNRTVQNEEVAVRRTVYKSQRPPSVSEAMGPSSPTFGEMYMSLEETSPQPQVEGDIYEDSSSEDVSVGANRGRHVYEDDPSRGDRNVPPRAGHLPPSTKSQQAEKRDSGYLSVEDLASQRSSVRLGSEDLEDIHEEACGDGVPPSSHARHGVASVHRRYLHSPHKRPHSGSLGARLPGNNSQGKFRGTRSGSSPTLDVCDETDEAMDKARSLPSLVHDARLAFNPSGLQARSVDVTSEFGDSREMEPYSADPLYGNLYEDTSSYTNSSLAHSCNDFLKLDSGDPTAFGESSDYLSPHAPGSMGRREEHRESASGRGSASSGLSSARQSSGAGSITSGPSSDASFSDYPSQEGDLSPFLVEGLLKANLMGHEWQWSWMALPEGCTLQRQHSDVVLRVPGGAVPAPTLIHGSVFTHFARVKEQIHIPPGQMIVSPVVELFTDSCPRFGTHVQLKLPHNLPAQFEEAKLKVFCFQYDIEPRLSPVPRIQHPSATLPECFYQITEDGEIWVHTRHFSVYLCTYCKKEVNIGLTAMVFCGGSATPAQDSFAQGEARVSVVVLDNKHKIVDIQEDIKVEEWERGLRFVDSKALRLLSHLEGKDQLSFHCTGLEPATWKHKTRSDHRAIFDEQQVYEMAEVVACCQDCERHRVEWVLVRETSSHQSLPSPSTFSGVVDILSVLAPTRRRSGDEDKKTTFFLSNVEFPNMRGSVQGRSRAREERFRSTRRILEHKLSDQQMLDLARGLELAKKDINNACKGYQGQRLRVRLLEMSYDRMHAQTFWLRLPGLLKKIGAEDALRDLQNQCLLPGRSSPETGEQRSPGQHSPDNNRDSQTQRKLSPPSENTQLEFQYGPKVAPPVKAQPAERHDQNRRNAGKNKAREALRPVPHEDNRRVENAGRPESGDTVPKSPQEPAGQGHAARGLASNDQTRPKRRLTSDPPERERDERFEHAGPRNTRQRRDQEKGDLAKPEDLDSTQRKEMWVGVQHGGRRQERTTHVGAPRGLPRQHLEKETDDESGEMTNLKTVV